jgi:hypothetical protein
VNLRELADVVRRRASGEPLDRIEAALTVSEELTSGADELIGQFVAEARAAGCSWTEIGQRIGVSKQAARQRFVRQGPGQPSLDPPERPGRRRRGRTGAVRCSFCGKPEAAALRLIAGPGVYICAECVSLCNEILAEEAAGPATP